MKFHLVIIFAAFLFGVTLITITTPVKAFEFGGGQSGGHGDTGSYGDNSKKDIYFYPSVYWPGLEELGWSNASPETRRIIVKPDTLGKFIVEIYKFFTGATAILALFMITYGGLLWLLAGGNQSTIGQAKEVITGAISGMVIALLSYALLASISQGLVSFKSLDVTQITVTATSTTETTDLGCQTPGLGLTPLNGNVALIISSEVSNPCLQSNTATMLSEAANRLYGGTGGGAWGRDNYKVVVKSAFRSRAKQEAEFRNNCSRCINRHPDDWQSACTSSMCSPATCNPWLSSGCPHTTGKAVDVQCQNRDGIVDSIGDCQLSLESFFIGQGFCRLNSESWHFEYPAVSSGCIRSAPNATTGDRDDCPTCCNSKTGANCNN